MSDEYKKGYKQGYADAMNWKVQNHLEHLPTAQPEQELVAYIDMSKWPPVRFKEGTLRVDIEHLDGQKLYTHPPVPMAQAKKPSQTFIDYLKSQSIENIAKELIEMQQIIDAFEKTKEPEQEPVAIYQLQKSDGSWIDQDKGSYRYNSQHGHTVRIVYTTTPTQQGCSQRKPLTDEEYSALAEQYTGADGLDCVDYGRAIARHYGIKE